MVKDKNTKMILTGIDDTNRSFFQPILFVSDLEEKEELIEAGVICDKLPVACGAIAIDAETKLARLISIYTLENYRRQGAAKMVLNALCKAAKAINVPRLDAYFTDEMDGISQLLKSFDFEVTKKGCQETYLLSDLIQNERVSSYLKKELSYDIKSFDILSEGEKKDVEKHLELHDFNVIYGEVEDSMSFVGYKNEKPTAVMLCSILKGEKKTSVMIDLVASFGMDVTALISLFTYGLLTFEKAGVEQLSFYAANPSISAFVERLTGGQKGKSIMNGTKLL